MLENDYSRRMQRWLERFGFTADPFATCEADQERDAIPFLFVDRPYVHHMVGDPSRPQPAFLLARRGEGKTATREIVVYECLQGRLRNRVLPVRYSNFDYLLGQVDGVIEHTTIRHHVNAIIRVTLEVLADEMTASHFSHLELSDRHLLRAYGNAYANPAVKHKLAQIIPGDFVQVDWNSFSPLETLAQLVRLVRQLGPSRERRFEAMYILVDRTDETPKGAAGALSLLQPLVADNVLLGVPGLAFKFFLPLDVGQPLLRNVRHDRLYSGIIAWDNSALRDLVEQRLAFYSNNRTEYFGQLCTAAARGNTLDRLIARSQASPRTLLKLCEALVGYHIKHAAESLIDSKDVTATLTEVEQKSELESISAPRFDRQVLPTLSPIKPSGQGLLLEDGGHVWVNGHPLDPPLSHLEFRLLEVLYRVAPEIVSQDDLIAAVWNASWNSEDTLSSADETNLRKLIARLRRRLEVDTTDSSRQLVRNAHGRGYWLAVP